jgi:hypothetical protein
MMNSQLIQEEIEVSCAYGDESFETQNRTDNPGPPDLPANESRGRNFVPFNVEKRTFHINTLPSTPLDLFQLFMPISLTEKWIDYTNNWVSYLQENGVADSWNTPLAKGSRIQDWEGLTSPEVYVWIGILIYLGIHREKSIRSHWNAPRPGVHAPLHAIIKFMTLRRFELLQRYLRISDHTNEATDLPRVFQACEEWSLHIQRVSASLFLPGSCLAVDECMIRYTGRSKETTLVKNKPTPHGFKVWAIAQDGFFIHWLWHVKGAKYTAARIQQLEEGKAANGKRKRKGKRASEQLIPLSNTQSVVICLCDTLPTGTYHVFVDNLFSSAALFRALRDRGHGATGTARPNCGLHKDLKRDKERDKNGKSGYKFNEVRVILTPDEQVGSPDAFLYISLTDLSIYSSPRSPKSVGKITASCSSFQLYTTVPMVNARISEGRSRVAGPYAQSLYSRNLVRNLRRLSLFRPLLLLITMK